MQPPLQQLRPIDNKPDVIPTPTPNTDGSSDGGGSNDYMLVGLTLAALVRCFDPKTLEEKP
eukprot:9500937-Pyramimonas_sp.AAC.1